MTKELEFIIQCDELGNTIGPIERKTAHLPGVREVVCHKVVWAMVYCEPTKRWCIQQKISKTLLRKVWDTSVGGHCAYEIKGDRFIETSFLENLKKEAKEELGITKGNFKIISEEHMKFNQLNEFVGFGLIIVQDEKVIPEDGEVIDYKWLTTKELDEFLNNGSKEFVKVLEITYNKCKNLV